MPDELSIQRRPDRPHEQASYAAQLALDEVVAWFIEDGFTDTDVLERCEESLERGREDTFTEDGD